MRPVRSGAPTRPWGSCCYWGLCGLLSAPVRLPRAAWALVAAVVFTAAVSVGGSVASAAQSRASQRSSEIKSLREQISHASEEEAELLDRVDAAADVRRELDVEVAAIDQKVAATQAEVDRARGEHETAVAELNHVRIQLEKARKTLNEGREILAKRAVAAYVGNPSANAANALLEVKSIRDVETTRVFFKVVVEAQQKQVQRLKGLREQAEAAQAVVTEHVEAAKVKFDEVKVGLANLQTVRAEADAVRDRAKAQENNERALFTEAKSRTDELEARLAVLQAESDSIGSILRLRGAGSGNRPGKLEPPIPFAAITSRFGPRTHPVLGTVRNHNGIDLRASTGTPVRAASDGEAVIAGARGGYGNTVVLGHGGNMATLYAHLSQVLVRPGQAVTAGQVVGLAGSTGMSTGPHLHFEVRLNGTPVDPLSYL
jgi:murein DD-endopeptidase MepM/ murein hydrolase activator NlpD